MDALLFLVIALGILALGTLLVLFRHREPKGENLGIKEFQREMNALVPEGRRPKKSAATSARPAAKPPKASGAVTAARITPQPIEKVVEVRILNRPDAPATPGAE
jgi:hypothetical protein